MILENIPQFRLLGSPRAVHDGHEIDLGTDRERRLVIALLAAKSEPLSREVLQQWIWDVPGQGAKNMLNELMAKLRARLNGMGMHRVLVAEHSLCKLVIPAQAVDLHRFRELVNTARAGDDERAADLLRQAVDLFEGDPLGALCGERINNFRTTLLDEYMSARLEYADVSLRLGRQEEILPGLAEFNRTEPFHEKVAGLLMRAHYQNNDPKRAGDVFQHIWKQLDENVGRTPGDELIELNQRIIEQDPSLLAPMRKKNPKRIGANMSTDEPAPKSTTTYTTGNKTAAGSWAVAMESFVVNRAGRSTPSRPSAAADHVRTGDKRIDGNGLVLEDIIVNESSE